MGNDEEDTKEAIEVVKRAQRLRILRSILGVSVKFGFIVLGILSTKLTPWSAFLVPMTQYDVLVYMILPWAAVSIPLAVWAKTLWMKRMKKQNDQN